MSIPRSSEDFVGLVRELCKQSRESEWLELKLNDAESQQIGEYISALANSAALLGRPTAYVVWGITDEPHSIAGTQFSPNTTKVGNEELENWLLRNLEPKIDFRFYEVSVDQKAVVLLEISQAFRHPVRFQGQEFIRIGTYKKRLKDFPEKERALWRVFDQTPFEDLAAIERISGDEVINLLDYPDYFFLLNQPLPAGRDGILEALSNDKLIRRSEDGLWTVTNLGGILLARKLSDFPRLSRKAVRVIQYRGNSRVTTIKEQSGGKGYASGFKGLIAYIMSVLPSNEVIEKALRKTVPMYPELAVRELVANALIHQDFSVTGTGPLIEIFEDRMEMSNPGIPLVKPDRFLDNPPRSRNEALAARMRRMGVCEERGTGVDKVVSQTEKYQLPAPLFEISGEATRAVLFAHRSLTKMDREDRIRACYLHACLRYVNREYVTNTSVRERFGIEPQNIALASRLIREAVEAGAIVLDDPLAAPKMMKYIPRWAANSARGT